MSQSVLGTLKACLLFLKTAFAARKSTGTGGEEGENKAGEAGRGGEKGEKRENAIRTGISCK